MKIVKENKIKENTFKKDSKKPFFGKTDLLIIGFILSVLLIVFLSVKLIFQKEKYITIEMVTSGGEWWWGTPHPFYWNVLPLNKGDIEYDLAKNPVFEILEIEKYTVDDRIMGLIKAKVRVKENKITKTYSFKQTRIEIGKTIGVSPNNISLIGQVMAIDGVSKFSEPYSVIVTTKSYGILPEEANNMVVGDTVQNTDGHVVAEIIDKKEEPARQTATDWKGNVLTKRNPITKDVTVTLRVEVRKDGDLKYYQYYQVVKPGLVVRFELQNATIEPYVIKVE